MKNPAISILMVFYNAEQYLKESLESIMRQSFRDYELLLVNDGSTDTSVQIINGFKDERIRLIHNSHDFINSLNLGLEKACGKYIARMDADDIMHPDRLLVQYSLMEDRADIDFCSSWCTFFAEKTRKPLQYSEHAGEVKSPLVSLLHKNVFIHPCMMFRTEFIRKNNLRYQDYTHAEDYKMWAEAANLGANFYIEPQSLLNYRCHKEQVSTAYREEQVKSSVRIKEEIMEYLLPYIPKELKELYECLSTSEANGFIKPNYRFEIMHNVLRYSKITR